MHRPVRLSVLALVALAVIGCGGDGGGPTPPADPLVEQAEDLFPAGASRDEARTLAAGVTTAAEADDAATAQARAFDLAELTFTEFYAGRLAPAAAQQPAAIDRLVTDAFGVAGLGDPGLEAASFTDEGLVAIVRAAGGTFVAATARAGIDIPAGAVPRTALLTFRRLPDSSQFAPKAGPLPTALDQYPLFYDFSFTPEIELTADAIIGLCQFADPASAYYPVDAVFARLQLAHPDPDDRSVIELLEVAEAPFLDCDGTTASVRGNVKSLSLQRRVGIGGRVRKFSPFAAVDPQSGPIAQPLTGTWVGTFQSTQSQVSLPVAFTLQQGQNGAITGTYVLPNQQLTRVGTVTATLNGTTLTSWTMTNGPACPGSWTGPASVNQASTQITATFTGQDCSTNNQPFTGNATITRDPNVVPVTITTATLPGATVNTAYTTTLAASGGTGTTTWQLGSGTLPAGLALNGATGVISGTPTATGSSTIGVIAVSGNATTSRQFTLTVGTPGNVQLSVTVAGAAANGTVTSAPAGVNCTLTAGTQGGTCAGSFAQGTQVTLTAVAGANSTFGGWSGGGCTGTGTCQVTLNTATSVTATFGVPAVNITTATLPDGTVGTAYNATLAATGGTGTYSWSVVQGTLPAGLALNASTGAITGTPTAAATSNLTVRATSGPQQAERALSITVAPAPTANLTVSRAGSGTGTVTSSPAGISCGADCSEAYTVGTQVTLTAAAASGSTFAGWSGGGCSGTGTCVVTVSAATAVTATFNTVSNIQILTSDGDLAGAAVGQPFGATFIVSPPDNYTCSITSGAVPGGLVLNAAACGLTGTPTAGGTFNFTLRATSSTSGQFGERAFTMTVAGGVGGNLSASEIATGLLHTCALRDQVAICWGATGGGATIVSGFNEGQFGNGSFAGTTVAPTVTSGNFRFSSIAAGGFNTCGLTLALGFRCWGSNDLGQLLDGTTTDRAVPTAFGSGPTFASVSMGADGTFCGLTATGEAWCWGAGTLGQIGDGAQLDRAAPTQVAGGLTFTSISVGGSHVCGVVTGGAAYCWGSNTDGKLGTGNTTPVSVPTAVQGGLTFSSVVAGLRHTCGITTGGPTYCWGDNASGQLGIAAGDVTDRSTPTLVGGGLTITRLALGTNHTCAVTVLNGAFCWGLNSRGQLGINATGNRALPNLVAGGRSWQRISAGDGVTCGIALSGEVFCWGAVGLLGANESNDSFVPLAVRAP